MKKFALPVVFAALLGLALLAPVGGEAAGVLDKDVILVGTEATYPPFEYRNEKNEVVGYDIDVVEAIAKHLGKKVEIVDMSFDGLIPALMTGKVDLVAAGMTNTEERRKKVNFSSVYYDIENAFVVRADDSSITKLDDLKGKIATVQIGTAQDTFITNTGLPAEIKRFQKNDDALMEIKVGRGDFCVVNLTVANAFLRNNKTFEEDLKIGFRNKIHREGEGIALGLPKGDEALLNAVNGAIETMKNNGEFDSIKKKYQMD
ncbi:transporter substrate-binding domain-containing protein [Aminivibrio sp.]|uniref:transporter substrate-binding domain-containing protein n=1 Tax=Aminivibrio sp. TaxID=1872489 RepID=UPI003D980ECC|nr:transporter substrate-binding domain-containing protein [Synergistaceae bacterium]